jgi:hypothetical protein
MYHNTPELLQSSIVLAGVTPLLAPQLKQQQAMAFQLEH